MAKRITIMIDDDLDKKLHLIQAKAIQNTGLELTARNYTHKQPDALDELVANHLPMPFRY